MLRGPLVVLIAVACLVSGCARLAVNQTGLSYYVSLQGDDANSGGRGAPFATLERARTMVRRLNQTGALPAGGVTVYVRGGRYAMAHGFVLDARDSGREDSPVVYRAFPGEWVCLTGGVLVAPELLQSPREGAAGLTRGVELKALGVAAAAAAPAVVQPGVGVPELFFADRPLPPAAADAAAELGAAGEWRVDPQAGVLYVWPPRGLGLAPLQLSALCEPIVTLEQSSYVTWQGFTMECVRGTAAVIKGGRGNLIAGCTIRNTGTDGVAVDGSGNGVVGCDIYNTGATGVRLQGGDRALLVAAGNYADNNHIHDIARGRQPEAAAIDLGGVGNRVTHNLIHGVPHSGIRYAGNDHLIEYNELLQTCLEAGADGALYSSRDWGSQGNLLRCNFIHHLGAATGRASGVCLDDCDSGDRIEENVFYQAGRAVVIAGGRSNTVQNNVFVDCETAIAVDERGRDRLRLGAGPAEGWDLRAKLEAVNYRQPPWSERYPHLADILADQPELPLHNSLSRNVCVGGRWLEAPETAAGRLQAQDNLVTTRDPGFVDPRRLDLRFREDAEVWTAVPGFTAIPMRRIGLYRDAIRASWPVRQPLCRGGLAPAAPATPAP